MAPAALMTHDEVFFDYVSRWMAKTFDRDPTVAGESPPLTADLAVPREQVLNELSSLSILLFPWWVIGSWVRWMHAIEELLIAFTLS